MEYAFRLLNFNVYNEDDPFSESGEYVDKKTFIIQMFGVDECGKKYSALVQGYKPFFYVKVDDKWTKDRKTEFVDHLKVYMGKYYANSIVDAKIIKRHKLYGFDNKKNHKFIYLEFANLAAFNKAKNMWYSDYDSGHKLLPNGYPYLNTNIMLYESNLPPLLRFFHIKEISPSGWIAIPKKKAQVITPNRVNVDYELSANITNIIPLPEKETRAPFKIMSMDIEASSSHGDFPVPIKTYKKLATNIIEYLENIDMSKLTKTSLKQLLGKMILSAFGYDSMHEIDLVYPKQKPSSKEHVIELCNKWFQCKVRSLEKNYDFISANNIETIFNRMATELSVDYEPTAEDDEVDTNEVENEGVVYNKNYIPKIKEYSSKSATIVDILLDKTFEREGKVNELNISLNAVFPKLEGDKCTFIGSTFMNYGDESPSYNHCIVLNTCDHPNLSNTTIETYNTEKEVLLAWQQLVQRENPDIIIGYNIFGFDYEFMFRRAEENNCVEDFLKLSKNVDEICGTINKDTGKWCIDTTKIKLASGEYDLKIIKMNGRLQIDLYNFYRKSENYNSYKLDYVSGLLINDYIKQIDHNIDDNTSTITSKNLTGLLVGSCIHIEEIANTINYYNNGEKYTVVEIDKANSKFKINGIVSPNMEKNVKWGLAKDDVTPKDIFRMTKGSSLDRSIIAKYCIQDCNLVHYLFNKSDVFTGYVEMANICSVPIDFLVMRGQGIRLQSLIAKECRKVRTLMPVLEKSELDEGYEGAIVLKPKTNLYLDNPVACNDYASLYPSSMISDNISHDSKVMTIEYDLAGNVVKEWGEKNPDGTYMYDNLPGKEYIDIEFDTYKYVRKTPQSAAEKIKCGRKICRFVQFPDGESGIIPAILKKLLKARKDTRKKIPLQTDAFMKNVLEQRQLSIKGSANSVYGGTGATTSAFCDLDIAACTTAIGRKLLTYGKRIIEETYKNRICETTNHGKVITNAEYIYGDTDSVFYTFNLTDMNKVPIRGKKALEITIELAQQAGELAAQFLKQPHDFEYEKTFMPYCLLSKKRYAGMLYEKNINKCKRKEMGLVLKRRDNAPIVKDIYGEIIDILMDKQSIPLAVEFLKLCLQRIINKEYPMDKLIISKSLRSGYKNPKAIAHKVLADRITARDPGNKPNSGDRIEYAYIVVPGKNKKQGEKIETPAYIRENNLKIDYTFYITNQIMKPIQQLFSLVLELLWELQNKRFKILKFKKDVAELHKTHGDTDAFDKKVEELKCKEIKILLFDEYLRETTNESNKNQSLTKWYTKK
jgi:DNA polymerase elongation subunit (family B)